MGALEKIEQRSLFLQKLAYEILTNDKVRLAHLGKLVGDAGMFDRDLSTILTILFSHNNLKNSSLPENEQPITLLREIASDLSERGFYNPSFDRRSAHLEKMTKGDFQNSNPKGGGVSAIDKPLRRLLEKIYEVRIHDAQQTADEKGRALSLRNGEQTLQSVESLIRSIKSLEASGVPYSVNESPERTTTRQTEYLNKRYDEIAASLNQAVGSTAEGEQVRLLHLHPSHRPDMKRTYAVKEEDFPTLTEIVKSSLRNPDQWNPRAAFEPIDAILPPRPKKVEPRGEGASLGAWEAEKKALMEMADDGPNGPSVRVVQLPFEPNQIDENFPSLELKSDKFLGHNVSETILESISRTRFSGFVDFDDKYRMMILWANAQEDDEKKDEWGNSYRDMLIKVLRAYRKKIQDVVGIEPEVHRTKTGASYYFTKPVSIVQLVKRFSDLMNLLNRINGSIDSQEKKWGFNRKFNRSIADDELPGFMEDVA